MMLMVAQFLGDDAVNQSIICDSSRGGEGAGERGEGGSSSNLFQRSSLGAGGWGWC